ncbi:MAG: hypothetical protein K8U03_16060 [Planctomycetia bacterium]|nr:hypothetical protein [Planctomycetia bacterium]
MSLKIRCPACKNVFDLGAASAGTLVQCPGCRASVRVPSTTPRSLPPAITVAPATAPPTPSKSKADSPKASTLTSEAWSASGFVVIAVLFFIFKRVGWISPSTTRADFALPLLLLVIAVCGLVLAGLWLAGVVRKAGAPPGSDPRPPLPPPPPFPPAAPPTPPAAEQWWLQVAGQATGPFATAVIIEAIRNGDFPGTTLACPVGGTQWLPIASRPTFATAFAPGADSPNAR